MWADCLFYCFLTDRNVMMQASESRVKGSQAKAWGEWRLRRHGDYQRVYAGSRKQFSASMTYFFARRLAPQPGLSARVGLTAGRVLGKAVERNRIKRRMREVVRKHISLLPPEVDVVLHPRKTVMSMDFAALEREVGVVFTRIAERLAKQLAVRDPGLNRETVVSVDEARL